MLTFLRNMFFIVFLCKNVSANEIPLYVMDVPPMTTIQHLRRGVLGEITQEAIARSGYTFQLFDYPSPRALATVGPAKDALIIPLAKLKDRELQFTWIAPLIKVERSFFTLKQPIDTFKKAKELKSIAVSRSTAAVEILHEAGIKDNQIIEINQGDTGPQMLLAGRVDAWYNPVAEAELLLKKVDSRRKVIRGKSIGATINYLGCSKSCDPILIQKLRQSLKTMSQDGTIKTIAAKYGKYDGLELITQF